MKFFRWRRFKSSFVQSFFGLLFNFGGLVAGTILAANIGLFRYSSLIVIAFPGVLSIRGAVAGLFSGNLSTALNIGEVMPTFRNNTARFYNLISLVLLMNIIGAMLLSLSLSILSIIVYHSTMLEVAEVILFIHIVFALSGLIIVPVNSMFSFLSFKNGLDPDYVVYPIMSTTADILISSLYILIASIYFPAGYLKHLLWILIIFYLFIPKIMTRDFEEVMEGIRESLRMIVIVSIIIEITGVGLNSIYSLIGEYPPIYMVYPAIISSIGDVGSIVGSYTTTRIALGEMGESIKDVIREINEILGAWIASLLMFIAYSMISALSHYLSYFQVIKLTVRLLFTNVLSTSSIIIISIIIAILTYRRGWNPDNFTIPIESSLADAITTLSLLLSIIVV